MRFSFQRRLTFSFLVIFALFSVGIVLFEQGRARRAKVEALRERLDAYAGGVILYGARPMDSLVRIMPPDLRITLVASDGSVRYDNVSDPAAMENHAARPEIVAARAGDVGVEVRTSASNGRRYIYYAKADDAGGVVRVALPYDIRVRPFLKPDNAFLYFVVALFLVGIYFVYYVGRLFGRAVGQAREREKNRRLKQEMTGNIAHELRTPVTSIRGFLEILLDNDLDPAREREYLERAYSQTRTLSSLIADMGLLTRMGEKSDSFDFAPVDVAGVAGRVRDDTAEAMARRAMSFDCVLPGELTVMGNEGLVYSILRNLVDNAVAYAGQGAAVRLRGAVHGRWVRFTFADTGAGIADERHLDRIFERFYRVDEGRTRYTGGSGLGLSIVKNAVQLHGGRIRVRNNGGLEFIFTLPFAEKSLSSPLGTKTD